MGVLLFAWKSITQNMRSLIRNSGQRNHARILAGSSDLATWHGNSLSFATTRKKASSHTQIILSSTFDLKFRQSEACLSQHHHTFQSILSIDNPNRIHFQYMPSESGKPITFSRKR